MTVTAVPGTPTVGLNAAMAGTSGAAVTVKGVVLVAEPVGVVTVIGPDAAPDGTVGDDPCGCGRDHGCGNAIKCDRVLARCFAKSRAMYSHGRSNRCALRRELNDRDDRRTLPFDREQVTDGIIRIDAGIPAWIHDSLDPPNSS